MCINQFCPQTKIVPCYAHQADTHSEECNFRRVADAKLAVYYLLMLDEAGMITCAQIVGILHYIHVSQSIILKALDPRRFLMFQSTYEKNSSAIPFSCLSTLQFFLISVICAAKQVIILCLSTIVGSFLYYHDRST